MSTSPANKMVRLCTPQAVPANSARGFTIETPAGSKNIFIVNSGQGFHAYENRCPHTGINLDWQPDQFLDADNTLIQCATHGALFRIEDGFCLFGPCASQSLAGLRLEIIEGELAVFV